MSSADIYDLSISLRIGISFRAEKQRKAVSTWTDTGNVPSAKLMGLNEAVFYMSYLEPDVEKNLAVKKAVYPGKKKLWQNTTIELTVIFLRGLLCWKLMRADKSE